MCKVTVSYPPSANRYWRHFRGRVVVSKEAKDYRQRVGWELLGAGVDLIEGDVVVTLDVYRKDRRRDVENCSKVLLDALQGFLYYNDNQIETLLLRRLDDRKNPRVEITIERAEGRYRLVKEA